MSAPAVPPPEGGAPSQQGDNQGGSQGNRGPSADQALRRRLRKLEKENQALKDAETARQQGELSELDRLKAENTALRGERDGATEQGRQERLRSRFEAAVGKAGAVDAAAAFKLADLSGVEFDDAGDPQGLDDAVAALKDSYGFLFQPLPPSGVGGSGGNPAAGNPANGGYTAAGVHAMEGKDWEKFKSDALSGRLKL